MYVDNFNQEIKVNELDKILSLLKERFEFNSNQFILTNSDSGFPQLSIFAKDNKYVVYFLGLNSNSFLSLGTNDKSIETEIFFENKEGTEIELLKKAIVDWDFVKNVVSYFYKTEQRDEGLSWIEL